MSLAWIRGLPPVSSAASSAEAAACVAPAEGAAEQLEAVPWITQQEARALLGLGTAQFVDCRPREQFHSGHVSGSVSVPVPEEVSQPALALLSQAQTVITYCDSDGGCARAVRIAQALRHRGLSDVRVLEGGLPAWLDNGYPAESGSCSLCPPN